MSSPSAPAVLFDKARSNSYTFFIVAAGAVRGGIISQRRLSINSSRIAFTLVVILVLGGAGNLYAQDAAVLKQADDLDWIGKYDEEKALLQAELPKAAEVAGQAEVYWRLSRATLNVADTGLKNKSFTTDQALKVFEEGEGYADKAIKLAPKSPRGYYWKSSNMGLWGQAKGIFDSLGKAQPMNDSLRLALKQDPGYADAFWVLGELFEKLPGWPISFGNVEYSVSLGRKSLDLMEADLAAGRIRGRTYGAVLALANHLWARNWDAKRRQGAQAEFKRQFNEKSDYVEKQYFYEGTIVIKNLSDRDEARELLRKVASELEANQNRTGGYEADLKEARQKLAEYK
jgi:hypothetical protein